MSDQQRAHLNGSYDETNSATNYGAMEQEPIFKTNEEIIEEIYDDLGTGRYQYFSLIFVVMLISNCAFLLYNVAYFESLPTYYCYDSGTDTWASCEKEIACEMASGEFYWSYSDSETYYNWIYIYSLECTAASRIGLLGTVLFLGTLVGTFFTIFSDKFGRRPVMMFNTIGQTFGLIGLLFFKDIILLYLMLFLIGMMIPLNPCVGQVYLVEVASIKHETSFLIISSVFEALPILSGPIYFMSGGKYTNVLIVMGVVVSIIATIQIFWIVESPRYLLATKQYEKLEEVIDYMAKFNGSKNMKPFRHYLENRDIVHSHSLTSKEQVMLFKLYMKDPAFVKNFFIMMFVYVQYVFNFYLLSFFISIMDGDINLNSLYSGLAMLASLAISGPVISKMGLKFSYISFIGMAAVASVLYIFLPNKSNQVIAILVFTARFGICPLQNIAFISANHIFPDQMKSSLIGLSDILGRLFCLAAPLAAELSDPKPFFILAIISTIAAFASQFFDYSVKTRLEKVTIERTQEKTYV